MREFIRADAWIGLCDLIDELGGDSADVLKSSGLSPEQLSPVDRYLPTSCFIATLKYAVASTGRKDFGMLLGLRRQLTSIGVVGLALANGENWRSIIAVAQRIGHVANPLISYQLAPTSRPGAEMIAVIPSDAADPDYHQVVERTVGFILTSARNLVRPDIVPLAVHFAHDRIADMDAYRAVLGVAPDFNQPASGLVVTTEDLDRPIASRSNEISKMALSYLEAQGLTRDNELLRAAQTSARALVELRAGGASELARTLGMELRTLQRRLKDEDATVEGVFDDARRSLLERLLIDDVHTNAQIAHALGYSSEATLNRNCKRWFGDTPSSVRSMLVAAAHDEGVMHNGNGQS